MFEENGFKVTCTTVHAIEYSYANIVVYTVPIKSLNVVIHPESYLLLKDEYDMKMYHSTALKQFPKRVNKGRKPISYGYKMEFDNEEELNRFLTKLLKLPTLKYGLTP